MCLPARIEQTIEKLVSFGTRQTLSSDMPASSGKGATAAAEWIKSEFERYSKECGGCLEVKTDEFIQEPGPRIPQAHEDHQRVRDPARHRPRECRPNRAGDAATTIRATAIPTTPPRPLPAPTMMAAAPPSAWNVLAC